VLIVFENGLFWLVVIKLFFPLGYMEKGVMLFLEV
jgi:hypothetical protein